ncbi:MAG: type IV pilus inner membrane component PilO [Planctomycetota bacterium]|jgi:Tfp pilus assembly protein PilO
MLFRKRKQIVICIAAAAMVLGFVLLRYQPLRGKIKAVEQTSAVQRLAIAKASAEREQLPILEDELLKLQKVVSKYQANIPDDRDIGAFLQKIADLMNEHNLGDQRVQPRQEIEAEGLSCIPVSMQCRGKLQQVFEFFRALQLLDRSVRIEHVEFENDSDFSGEVSMKAETIIYYRSGGEQV